MRDLFSFAGAIVIALLSQIVEPWSLYWWLGMGLASCFAAFAGGDLLRRKFKERRQRKNAKRPVEIVFDKECVETRELLHGPHGESFFVKVINNTNHTLENVSLKTVPNRFSAIWIGQAYREEGHTSFDVLTLKTWEKLLPNDPQRVFLFGEKYKGHPSSADYMLHKPQKFSLRAVGHNVASHEIELEFDLRKRPMLRAV